VRPALLARTGLGASRGASSFAALCRRDDRAALVPYTAMGRRAAPPRCCLPGVSARAFPARLQRALAPLGFSVETLLGPLDVFQHTDLVFAPSRARAPVVIVHDLCFLRGQGWHDRGFVRPRRAPRARAAATARAVVVPQRARRPRHVAAPASRPAARVHVVPVGADHVDRFPDATPRASPRCAAARPAADGALVLLPGTREPRKNQLAALAAFLRARTRRARRAGRAAAGRPARLGLRRARGAPRRPGAGRRRGRRGRGGRGRPRRALRGADVVLYPSFEGGLRPARGRGPALRPRGAHLGGHAHGRPWRRRACGRGPARTPCARCGRWPSCWPTRPAAQALGEAAARAWPRRSPGTPRAAGLAQLYRTSSRT
jgi:hypothetical protein